MEQRDYSRETSRLRSAKEVYSHGELAGVVQALDQFEGTDKRSGFDEMVDARRQIIASLAELKTWDELNIDRLQQLKTDFVRSIGWYKFNEKYGSGPDIWWQGTVGEAVSMRMLAQNGYLLGGDDNRVYIADHDTKADKAKIDFSFRIVLADGRKVLVCLQVKTSGKLPAGELHLVNLNREHVREANPNILAQFGLNYQEIQGIQRGGHRMLAKLWEKKDEETPEEVVSVLVGLGVQGASADQFSGWKQLMLDVGRGRDSNLGHRFGIGLESILYGRDDEEESNIELGVSNWMDEIFEPEKPRSGEARYVWPPEKQADVIPKEEAPRVKPRERNPI